MFYFLKKENKIGRYGVSVNVYTHLLDSTCVGAINANRLDVILPPVCPGYRGEVVHSDRGMSLLASIKQS